MVQAGQNNVGASIVVNTIAQTHSAVIENAYLTAGSSGSVTVSATDATRIIGVAVGVGLSFGTFAGVASIAANEITSRMIARIGTDSDPAGSNQTTVSAYDVNVQATNRANVRGAAAARSALALARPRSVCRWSTTSSGTMFRRRSPAV